MKEGSKTNKKSKAKKTETLEEKVHRHLRDKNDIITEQDMKEIVVGVDAIDTEKPDEPSILAEDIHPKKAITPWDLLDEEGD